MSDIIDIITNPTYQAIITSAGAIGGSILIGIPIGKFLERQRQQQSSENDIVQNMLRDYIACIEGMRQHYIRKHLRATTIQDKQFFRRLLEELDDNLDSNQRQLLDIIERTRRGR